MQYVHVHGVHVLICTSTLHVLHGPTESINISYGLGGNETCILCHMHTASQLVQGTCPAHSKDVVWWRVELVTW